MLKQTISERLLVQGYFQAFAATAYGWSCMRLAFSLMSRQSAWHAPAVFACIFEGQTLKAALVIKENWPSPLHVHFLAIWHSL